MNTGIVSYLSSMFEPFNTQKLRVETLRDNSITQIAMIGDTQLVCRADMLRHVTSCLSLREFIINNLGFMV